MLAAMFFVHPYYLLTTLIPFWALGSLAAQYRARFKARWWKWSALVLVIALACEVSTVKFNRAIFASLR